MGFFFWQAKDKNEILIKNEDISGVIT